MGGKRATGRRAAWRAAPIVEWLLREGRLIADPIALIDALAERLIAAGAPVWRLRFGFSSVHPQIAMWGYVWVRGKGAEITRVGHGFQSSEAFIGSPAERLMQTQAPVRVRLDRLAPDAHRMLHELAEMGGVDYVLLPMRFSDASMTLFGVTTDRRPGFAAADLRKFEALAEALSPVFEVIKLRRVAKTLLDTYVGRRTGERVLRGLVKRGDGETIHAALWFSDLREFTALTETLPARKVLAMLNAYFEHVDAAVRPRGGEILRFIGDAMLIVFPAQTTREVDAACRAAVDAALDAFSNLAALNHRRRRAGEPQIEFGVGLNVGEVIYGNVGAPDRLDFTVMGPAVNRTARLEGLTKTLGVPLLMSAEFAAHLRAPVRSLGAHALQRVPQPQEVFALEEMLAAARAAQPDAA
ncbi:MAG: adenylate/guanylate cyclase domain-containing protein [Burkholderiales bacterium]|nr:adenylate/guanylate cyclase domain-containing protein [Burkholderiales bacterium]